MRTVLCIFAIALAWPALAGETSPAPIALLPGQALTITTDAATTPAHARIIGISRAALDAHGEAMALRLAGATCNKPACEAIVVRKGELGIEPAPSPANAIKLSFLIAPETGHSVLVVENGYAQALTYRARITSRGHSAPTDVCLVLPMKRSYEDWPYVIEKVELDDFQLKPWSEADGIPCA